MRQEVSTVDFSPNIDCHLALRNKGMIYKYVRAQGIQETACLIAQLPQSLT
jgi:hypothetical protein